MNVSNELYDFVAKPTPIDLTPVKDPGMKCLVHLAVSLGWNVHQKQNQPVVITAKDGHQKRLPTNTSIRMSVFQTALSSIMVHTEELKIPTIDLVDALIALHKPSVDHQRRMRLAVGETPGQHRERVASAEAELKGAREPQPLTTRIEIPQEQWDMVSDLLEGDEGAARAATEGDMEYTPADGGEHGEVVSREPFQAVRNTDHRGQVVTRYQSDTSFERVWTDGYKDYECMVCTRAFPSPRGVGAHSQMHVKGRDTPWKRTRETVVREPIDMPTEATLEWESPPDTATWVPEPELMEDEPSWTKTPVPVLPIDLVSEGFILGQIAALVAPDLIAKVAALEAENQQLRERLNEVEGEFDAFIELAASRRKKPDGG